MEKLLEYNCIDGENDVIFHIFDQIKVLRIPFLMGQCHLCMEGHLKLCLQSLYFSDKIDFYNQKYDFTFIMFQEENKHVCGYAKTLVLC